MVVENPKRRAKRTASKVLLVDGQEADLARTAAFLRDEGHQVVALTRAEAATPVFGAFQPELVVFTVSSVDDPALEVGRRLNELSQGGIPLMYLVESQRAERAMIEASCFGRGNGIAVLHKPLDLEAVSARIRSVLRLREGLERRCREMIDGREVSLRDPLTGSWNRRYLHAAIGQEIRRAERYGGGFSVVAASIENFGPFRRSYGRELSERLLVYGSVVLSQSARAVDLLARVGQSEFALLLPETPAESLPAFEVRLRGRIRLARFELDSRAVRPGIVLGSASFPEVVGTPADLVRAALRDLRSTQRRPDWAAVEAGA